jgi:ABC-type spermidine/putrescine transport system permease subunit II
MSTATLVIAICTAVLAVQLVLLASVMFEHHGED